MSSWKEGQVLNMPDINLHGFKCYFNLHAQCVQFVGGPEILKKGEETSQLFRFAREKASQKENASAKCASVLGLIVGLVSIPA